MIFLGLIPARGGSKSIPKKNLAICGGQSLLARAAQGAQQSGVLDRIHLSTDDAEMAEMGLAMGLDVPFERPGALAGDEASMLGVMQYVLKEYDKRGFRADAVVLLQPTSPLRKSSHIVAATERYQQTGAATLVSVVKVPHQFTPNSLLQMNEGELTQWMAGNKAVYRRQDKPVFYARNGPAILIVKREVLEEGGLYGQPTVGFEMSSQDSIDIDDFDDLAMASAILRDRQASR